MQIKIKKLSPLATIPSYQTDFAAGFDLHAAEEMVIEPKKSAAIGVGLAFAIESGYEMQVRPRSGLALKHKITVLNTPGTIDSDYRGEIKVILINHGDEPFKVNIGDRIAQGVIARVERATFVEVEELDATTRGSGGFGSTGI